MTLNSRFNLIEDTKATLQEFGPILNALPRDGAEPKPLISLASESSPAIAGRVSPTSTGDFEIVIPDGVLYRLLAWLRMLLPYWEWPPLRRLVSLLEPFGEDKFHLPRRLGPILGTYDDLSTLVRDVGAMDFKQPLPEVFWSDIAGMLTIGYQHLVLHEAAHVLRGHFDLRNLILKEVRLAEFGLSKEVALAGLELDADLHAGLTAAILAKTEAAEDPIVLERIALRSGYVWASLLGLNDHRKKLLAHFKEEIYIPPPMRYEFIFQGAIDGLAAVLPEAQEFWQINVRLSREKALTAMSWATNDYADKDTEKGKLQWLLGGFLTPITADPFSPSLRAFLRTESQWRSRYDGFERWRDAVLPDPDFPQERPKKGKTGKPIKSR